MCQIDIYPYGESHYMTLSCRQNNNHFQFYNANPEGYVREGDCITRAIATVLDKPWREIIVEQGNFALENSRSFGSQVVKDLIMDKYDYVKMPEPHKSNGKKYTVEEFCFWLTRNGGRKPVLVSVNHHMTALKIIDGRYKIFDTWDCGYMIVRGFYISADEPLLASC